MLSAETEGLGQNSVYHFLSWKCGVKREVLQLDHFSQSLLQVHGLNERPLIFLIPYLLELLIPQ